MALPKAPLRPTQNWFPAILRQAIATPQVFSSKYLQLPGTTKMHPLVTKLQLVAFLLSNNTYKIKSYHKQQKTCSSPPGVIQQKIDMLKIPKIGAILYFKEYPFISTSFRRYGSFPYRFI